MDIYALRLKLMVPSFLLRNSGYNSASHEVLIRQQLLAQTQSIQRQFCCFSRSQTGTAIPGLIPPEPALPAAVLPSVRHALAVHDRPRSHWMVLQTGHTTATVRRLRALPVTIGIPSTCTILVKVSRAITRLATIAVLQTA